MARRGKSKTLNQATDQLNRITDYYERTGRGETARRIREGSMSVGGVIGNIADRVSMRGRDPFTRAGMNMKVSFRDRIKTPTDAEYNTAVAAAKRNAAIKATRRRRANLMYGENRKNNSITAAEWRLKRKAQGLSVG